MFKARHVTIWGIALILLAALGLAQTDGLPSAAGRGDCNCTRIPYRPEPPCAKHCAALGAAWVDRLTLRSVLGLSAGDVEKIVLAQPKIRTARTGATAAEIMEKEVGSETFGRLSRSVAGLEGDSSKAMVWTKAAAAARPKTQSSTPPDLEIINGSQKNIEKMAVRKSK